MTTLPGYQLQVLRALERERTLDRHQLASAAGLTPTEVDGALDKLLSLGYIVRLSREGEDRFRLCEAALNRLFITA